MSVYPLPTPLRRPSAAEPAAARMAQLRAEAAELAREQTVDFEAAIGGLIALADAIAEGGEAYPVGAREVARHLSGQLAVAASRLEVLRSR